MKMIIKSIKNNKWGIFLILIASILTSIGQLFWKLSHGQLNLYLVLGFSLYFMGAVFMILSFRFGSLSVLHPLLSFGYIFACFLGVIFLNEPLTIQKIIGTSIIIIGAIFVGGGDS